MEQTGNNTHFRAKSSEIAGSLKTPPATPQKSTTSGKRNRLPRYYNFDRENECTIKMTDGVNVIVEGSLGADNYKAPRALGYLMKVGNKWVAAVGKQRSEPLPLHEAKAAAKAMHRNPGPDYEGDSILALNRVEAGEIDRIGAKLERERERPELLRAVWETELCVPLIDGERA
jgi:hypothetical protein